MRVATLFLACLACAGHSRRVRAASEERQGDSKSLANLLVALNPSTAFTPSSPGVLQTRGSPLERASTPLLQEKTDMSQAIPFLKRPPKLDGTMAGDIGFDPFLITDKVNIQWSREAELKHGRICMLATVGWIVVDLGFRVPFAPEVSSLYAHDAAVERGPMWALFLFCAVIEVFAGIPKCFQILNDPGAAPGGDYKFDPLGFGGGITGDLAEKELANGRLAMMAFSGIVTQSALTGGGFPYTFNGVSDLVPPLAVGTMPGFGS